MRRGHLIQIGKDLAFEVQNFQNGLDDIIRIFDGICHTGGKRYSLPGRFGLFFGQASFFNSARQVGVGEVFRFFENFRVDVGAHRFVPVNRTQHRDLMPHVSGADDGHVFNVVDVHVFVPFFGVCIFVVQGHRHSQT